MYTMCDNVAMVAMLGLCTWHAMIPASGNLYPYDDQPFILTTQEQTETVLLTVQPKKSDLQLITSVNNAMSMLTRTNSKFTTA